MASNPILEIIHSDKACEYVFFRIDVSESPMVAAYHRDGPGAEDMTQDEFAALLSQGQYLVQEIERDEAELLCAPHTGYLVGNSQTGFRRKA